MGAIMNSEATISPVAKDKYVFSLPEACVFTTLKMTKVRELVRTGELPSIRVGRRVLIPRAALIDWLDARVAPARSAQAA